MMNENTPNKPEDQMNQNSESADQHTPEENVVNLDESSPLEDALKETSLNPEDHIARLEKELAENKDRTMRALADAENTRRRALKDREDAGKYAISKFAKDLLDFSDNFGRAIQSIPDEAKSDDRVKKVIEGIEAMESELMAVFDRNGIKKISPMDEAFDANFHEVMFEAPFPGKEAGTIIQVVEPGYIINDRLLRAAKVGIAKAEEGGAAPAPEPKDPGTNIDQEA
ncbi:MAG: nucleotide exchange factor GrpE [Pseudomonadota bacterium]